MYSLKNEETNKERFCQSYENNYLLFYVLYYIHNVEKVATHKYLNLQMYIALSLSKQDSFLIFTLTFPQCFPCNRISFPALTLVMIYGETHTRLSRRQQWIGAPRIDRIVEKLVEKLVKKRAPAPHVAARRGADCEELQISNGKLTSSIDEQFARALTLIVNQPIRSPCLSRAYIMR